MQVTFKFRRATAAEWAATNPQLAEGEPGVDMTSGHFKVGDGTTLWNDLPYVGGDGGGGGGPVYWVDINGKPTTFPPAPHAHNPDDITGLDQRISNDVSTLIHAGANITIDNSVPGALTISSTGGGGTTDPQVVRDTMGAALKGVGVITTLYDSVAQTITIDAPTAVSQDALDLAQGADQAYADRQIAALRAEVLTLLGRPAQPTGLTIGTITSSSVDMTWDANTDTITGYYVLRNGTIIATLTGGTLATSYHDAAGLSPDTVYTYTIEAYNANGPSTPSVGADAHTSTVTSNLPSKPTLSPVTSTASSVTYGWTAATAPTGFPITAYKVYKDGSGTALHTLASTVFSDSDTGLPANDTHSYRVSAVNSAGEGPLSDAVSMTSVSAVMPVRGAFANTPNALNTSTVSATLPANIQNGDAGFFVVESNTATNTIPTDPTGWSLIDHLVATSNNRTVFLYGKKMVEADSGATVTVTFANGSRCTLGGVVLSRSLNVPDAIVALQDNSDDASLDIAAITPNSGNTNLLTLVGTRYSLLTGTNSVTPPSTWAEAVDIVSTHTSTPLVGVWAATKPLPGSASAQSAVSATYAQADAQDIGWLLAVAPDPNLPTQPTLTKGTITATQVNLTWTGASAPGAHPITGYYVYRDGTRIATLTGVTLATTYQDSGRTANTTYTYAVRAFNDDGTGAQSAAVDATTTGTGTARFNGDPGAGNLYLGSSNGGNFQGYTISDFDKFIYGNPPTKKFVLSRKYNGGAMVWSSGDQTEIKGWISAGRIPVISHKLGGYSAAQVLAGNADSDIDANADFYASLGGPAWVSFWHEPDNDAIWSVGSGGAQNYRKVFRYIVNRTHNYTNSSSVRGDAKIAFFSCLLGTVFANGTTNWRNWHPNWNDAATAWLTNGPYEGTNGSYVHINGFDRYDPAVPANYPFQSSTRNKSWDNLHADFIAAIAANPSQTRPWMIGEFGTYTLPATLDDTGITVAQIYSDEANHGPTQAGGVVGILHWDNQAVAFDDQYDPGRVRRDALKNMIDANSQVKMLTT